MWVIFNLQWKNLQLGIVAGIYRYVHIQILYEQNAVLLLLLLLLLSVVGTYLSRKV
jgi:hypothetical protein